MERTVWCPTCGKEMTVPENAEFVHCTGGYTHPPTAVIGGPRPTEWPQGVPWLPGIDNVEWLKDRN